jgi:hypothetical protein
MHDQSNELEVSFKPETGKAVIEGKTAIPFQSFVTLILQRKVQLLFKEHAKEPVVINSDLLTRLASAPQDSRENTGHLVLVSIGLGAVGGVAVFSAVQLVLMLSDFTLGVKEHAIILGCIAGVALLGALLMYVQKMPKSDKLTDSVENIARFLGK